MKFYYCPFCFVRIFDLTLLHRKADNGTDCHSYYQCMKCAKEFWEPITLFTCYIGESHDPSRNICKTDLHY
jgi:DNA-directed RNA polymerase subunit RPC12/RpoP